MQLISWQILEKHVLNQVTPVDPNTKLREAQEEPAVDRQMYQRLAGKFI